MRTHWILVNRGARKGRHVVAKKKSGYPRTEAEQKGKKKKIGELGGMLGRRSPIGQSRGVACKKTGQGKRNSVEKGLNHVGCQKRKPGKAEQGPSAQNCEKGALKETTLSS